MSDNKCESCDGTGCEFSGVEYMGQHEVVGCAECCGTGFADVSAGVESLRAELTTTRQRLEQLEEFGITNLYLQRDEARFLLSKAESQLATTRQERDALAVFIQERRTHYAQMQGANKGHLFDWFMGKKDFADELLAEIERLKGATK